MSADFKPVLDGYTNLRPFMFWAQTTLPTVFDDSLSYYEVLTKLVKMVNTLLENTNVAEENIERINQAFAQLQEYVNKYLEDLDIQEEINAKLDAMAQDGTLSALVAPLVNTAVSEQIGEVTHDLLPGTLDYMLGDVVDEKLPALMPDYVPDAVDEWLSVHVNPESDVVIDNTLTISGAAADSKTVGDRFNNLEGVGATLVGSYKVNTTTGNLDYDVNWLSYMFPVNSFFNFTFYYEFDFIPTPIEYRTYGFYTSNTFDTFIDGGEFLQVLEFVSIGGTGTEIPSNAECVIISVKGNTTTVNPEDFKVSVFSNGGEIIRSINNLKTATPQIFGDIAPIEYDDISEHSYSSGDICIFNGRLVEFNTTVEIGDNITNEKYSFTTIAAQLSKLAVRVN